MIEGGKDLCIVQICGLFNSVLSYRVEVSALKSNIALIS